MMITYDQFIDTIPTVSKLTDKRTFAASLSTALELDIRPGLGEDVYASLKQSVDNRSLIASIAAVGATTEVTTETETGLSTGDSVFVEFSGTVTAINGAWTATVISPTVFSIPVDTTATAGGFVAGTARVTPIDAIHQELLEKLAPSVAHFTCAAMIDYIRVTLNQNGIEKTGGREDVDEVPTGGEIERMRKRMQVIGNQLINDVKRWLKDNQGQFVELAQYDDCEENPATKPKSQRIFWGV